MIVLLDNEAFVKSKVGKLVIGKLIVGDVVR